VIGWLKLVELGLSLLNGFVGFLHDQKLIDAGAAKAVAAGLSQSLDAVKSAQAARQKSDADFEAHPETQTDDDGFERRD
jgi:hypothetical protein